MSTLAELKKLARDRRIPNRSKLKRKQEFLAALGIQDQKRTPGTGSSQSARQVQAIAKRHGFAKSHAAEAIGQKLGSDEQKKAAIKEDILKAVNKSLKSKEKQLGRKLTPEEKRGVAASAIKSQVMKLKGIEVAKKDTRDFSKVSHAALKMMAQSYDVNIKGMKRPEIEAALRKTKVTHKDIADHADASSYAPVREKKSGSKKSNPRETSAPEIKSPNPIRKPYEKSDERFGSKAGRVAKGSLLHSPNQLKVEYADEVELQPSQAKSSLSPREKTNLAAGIKKNGNIMPVFVRALPRRPDQESHEDDPIEAVHNGYLLDIAKKAGREKVATIEINPGQIEQLQLEARTPSGFRKGMSNLATSPTGLTHETSYHTQGTFSDHGSKSTHIGEIHSLPGEAKPHYSPEEEAKIIKGMKKHGNVMPVFVKELPKAKSFTGGNEDAELQVVMNGHLLDLAKKAGIKKVFTMLVDDTVANQLRTEAVGGASKR
jgi:hypothetical protein